MLKLYQISTNVLVDGLAMLVVHFVLFYSYGRIDLLFVRSQTIFILLLTTNIYLCAHSTAASATFKFAQRRLSVI